MQGICWGQQNGRLYQAQWGEITHTLVEKLVSDVFGKLLLKYVDHEPFAKVAPLPSSPNM